MPVMTSTLDISASRIAATWLSARPNPMRFATHGNALSASIQGHGSVPFKHKMCEPVGDDVPYTTPGISGRYRAERIIGEHLKRLVTLRQDLQRLRTAWEESQASRARDAIYQYLTAVFDLVAWWVADNRAIERGRKALGLGTGRLANPVGDHCALLQLEIGAPGG